MTDPNDKDLFMSMFWCINAMNGGSFGPLRIAGPHMNATVAGRTVHYTTVSLSRRWRLSGEGWSADMTGTGIKCRVSITGDRNAMERDVILFNLAS